MQLCSTLCTETIESNQITEFYLRVYVVVQQSETSSNVQQSETSFVREWLHSNDHLGGGPAEQNKPRLNTLNNPISKCDNINFSEV